MKKFLFTLATLLLTGSAFATEYFHIEDFEATPGTQKTVVVKAHFEALVSAWQCWIQLPEGVTIVRRLTSTEANITYLAPVEIEDEETGDVTVEYREKTLEPGITEGATPGEFVGITDALLSEWDYIDGVITNCGAIKWKPGDFGMFRLRLEFAEDFKGGVITVITEPACGSDPRGNVCVMDPMQHHEKPCNVTVKQDLAGDINIGNPDENGKVTIEYTGDEEGVQLAVVVKDNAGNVVEATFENGVLQLPDYGEYTVEVTASATGYNDKDADKDVKWEKKEVAAPVINYTTNDTEVVVTITWPESDGEKVYTGQYTYPRTDEDQSFDVEAYVTEGETCQESTHATKTIPVPKKEVIATPTITFSGEETTTMTITVSCETEGVTLYVNGTEVEGNPYTYTVTRADVYTAGTVNVTAVAKKGNLESETATDSKAWVVQKPLAPEATKVETPADDKVTVDFTPAEGTAVSVKVDGETVDLPYDIDRPAYGEEPITVTFEVTVTGDNYTTNTYTVDVTVDPQDPTAAKPIITFTPDATGVTVEIENYTTYTITVNDVVVDQLRAVPTHIDKGDVDKHIVVWAKNAPANMIPAEDTKEYNLPAKTVYNTPDPVIGTPTVNENDVTFTVTGEGTVTVTVTYNDGTTETFTGTDEVEVTIPRTDQDFTATVTATAKSNKEGYDVINEGTAGPTTVNVPAVQTKEPTITYEYGTAEFGENGQVIVDGRYATITITNNDEKDADIEYSLDNGETWLPYNPAVPVTVSGEGTHTVMARAKAEGKAMSDTATENIVIGPTTSVNELTNGKTVAGVRYFNMAGQEMQEANGITIVVTTYTDGTTSAVKVIK